MSRVFILSLIAGVVGGMLAARKGRSHIFWGVLCFLFPPVVLATLFLPPVVGRGGGVPVCADCGRPLDPATNRCTRCNSGSSRTDRQGTIEMVECRSCGTVVPRERICSQCGAVL